MIGDGPDNVTIDHNTIFSTNPQFIWLYGGTAAAPSAATNSRFTNNMTAHNSYGIMASGLVYRQRHHQQISAGLQQRHRERHRRRQRLEVSGRQLLSDRRHMDGELPNLATGDYHLQADSTFKHAGLDGKDLGADIDALDKHVPIALSGRDDANVLKILPALLNEGVFNQSYVESIACAGNTGACVFSASENTLPAGLSFDATAGLISGVPQEARTGSITISAYDSKRPQNSATATLEVKIGPPPMSIVMPPAADGQVGNAFTMATTVEGAMGATTWSVIDGALPPGTTLDPFSGVISGVPSTWGGFTATVEARDSWTDPRVASAPTTIAVLPANLAIDAFSLANAIAGTPYTASFTASGGTGHPTWSVIDGHLPDGMTLDGSGVLNGTPTVAATFTFTLRAADALYPQIFADITLALNVDVPAPVNVAGPEIVLYAADATKIAGTWSIVADASAAGGRRVWNKDVAAAKVPAALANPANYFELTFNAFAGMGYHLWLRGKADKDSWANDSVFVQFSGSVNAAGTAVNRIGTTGAATVSIEEGANAGVAGWGWADENYGALGGNDVLQDRRPADDSHPGARRRDVDRPDRPERRSLRDPRARQDEERHHDPDQRIDAADNVDRCAGTGARDVWHTLRRDAVGERKHRLDDLVGGVGTAAGRHGAERRRRPERHADLDRRLHLHRAGAGRRLAGERGHRADRAHGRGAGLYRCRAGAVAGRGRPAV